MKSVLLVLAGFIAGAMLTLLLAVAYVRTNNVLVTAADIQREREMDVVLPQASEARPLIVRPNELIVHVSADGEYVLEDEVLDEGALEAALRAAWSNSPGRLQVVIRASKDSQTKHIAAVMDLCNKTNIRDYTLATE